MDSSNRPVALVTGASSGIGAALARELARHGHDLVLSARHREPMDGLAEELRGSGAAVTVIASDLSVAGATAALVQELAAASLDIDVLVNNAGLGSFGSFDRTDPARHAEIMQVNIVALTELTEMLLPAMLERRRGKVVLVASTASFLPCPNMAVYAASKAYVRSFGEALAQELKDTGVIVNVLCPGATATNFMAVAGGTPSGLQAHRMMSADAVARIGYAGMARGQRVTVTGLLNRLLAFAAIHTPHFVTLPATAKTLARD